MTQLHKELFAAASIHVPLNEFIKRIRTEANCSFRGFETTYRRANIRAMRKALHVLGIFVERRDEQWQLCQYVFDRNQYTRYPVPDFFARTERGAMVYALARFLNGER